MKNKIHGTPVVPVFVAQAKEEDENGIKKMKFTPFTSRDVDHTTFPDKPHARGNDFQFIITNMRYV